MFLEHQIIRMISKGSCDTAEDWRNGCWKFSFDKLHFKAY